MPRERNLKNLKTEKEGIQILKEKISNFHTPNSEERKYIYKILDMVLSHLFLNLHKIVRFD